MPTSGTVFKPKYTGSMRFAFYLWPVWTALFLYFIYRATALRSFNPDAILAIVFGIMTLSMPFRVFREMRFEDKIIVKRYFLPDIVIPYKEITAFNSLAVKTGKVSVSLFLMTPKSFGELEDIFHKLSSERKVKLKKK